MNDPLSVLRAYSAAHEAIRGITAADGPLTISDAYRRWLNEEAYSLDEAMSNGMTDTEYCEATDITPEEWERYKSGPTHQPGPDTDRLIAQGIYAAGDQGNPEDNRHHGSER